MLLDPPSLSENILAQQSELYLIRSTLVLRVILKPRSLEVLDCVRLAIVWVYFSELVADWVPESRQPTVVLPVGLKTIG